MSADDDQDLDQEEDQIDGQSEEDSRTADMTKFG